VLDKPALLDGFSLGNYLLLLDDTSRLTRPGKASVSAQADELLDRLGTTREAWEKTLTLMFNRPYPKGVTLAFGRKELGEAAKKRGCRPMVNLNGGPARRLSTLPPPNLLRSGPLLLARLLGVCAKHTLSTAKTGPSRRPHLSNGLNSRFLGRPTRRGPLKLPRSSAAPSEDRPPLREVSPFLGGLSMPWPTSRSAFPRVRKSPRCQDH
jgi:hypothetical protein